MFTYLKLALEGLLEPRVVASLLHELPARNHDHVQPRDRQSVDGAISGSQLRKGARWVVQVQAGEIAYDGDGRRLWDALKLLQSFDGDWLGLLLLLGRHREIFGEWICLFP